MRLSQTFILTGLIFLVIGMMFGIWMGASEKFQYADAHAHWNLAGFVVSTAYGLIHRAFPELSASKLAWPQFGLHLAAVPVFVAGIFVVDATHQIGLVIVGSLMVLAAALTFLWMFYSRGFRQA